MAEPVLRIETRKVYLMPGSNRAYLSKRGAVVAYCNRRFLAKHCGCERGDDEYPGVTCHFHRGDERARKILFRYVRLVLKEVRRA